MEPFSPNLTVQPRDVLYPQRDCTNTHESVSTGPSFSFQQYWRVVRPSPKDGETTRVRGRSGPRGSHQAGSEKRLEGERGERSVRRYTNRRGVRLRVARVTTLLC